MPPLPSPHTTKEHQKQEQMKPAIEGISTKLTLQHITKRKRLSEVLPLLQDVSSLQTREQLQVEAVGKPYVRLLVHGYLKSSKSDVAGDASEAPSLA